MHGDLNMPLAGDPPPKTDPARPALVLLVASVVELIAAVVLCTLNDDSCDGTTAYAISAGAVSVALALLVLSALRYDDAMPGLLLDMVPHLSAFLVLWWLPAWLTFTFVRPFAELCNGFFACWAALVAAIWLVRCELPAVDGFISRFVEVAQGTLAEKAYVAGLLCTSAFVWIEASILHSVQPSGWLAWTIGVGVVSFVACLCYLGAHEHVASHSRHVALALLAWWLQGLVISFVPTGFTGSVNGYLALWASLFLAAYFAFGAHAPRGAFADDGGGGGAPSSSQYGPVGAATTPQPFMSGATFEGFGPSASANLVAPPPEGLGSGI